MLDLCDANQINIRMNEIILPLMAVMLLLAAFFAIRSERRAQRADWKAKDTMKAAEAMIELTKAVCLDAENQVKDLQEQIERLQERERSQALELEECKKALAEALARPVIVLRDDDPLAFVCDTHTLPLANAPAVPLAVVGSQRKKLIPQSKI